MIDAAILHYCKYQERCHQEVRNKLYELGCTTPDVEHHLSQLIEQGVLNEERFAKLYAGGKFRMKHWGKEKIKQQLKLRKVSDYCIRKGMQEIDPEQYDATLRRLAERKLAELAKEKNKMALQMKIYRYLVQKGYERDLVADVVKELTTKDYN